MAATPAPVEDDDTKQAFQASFVADDDLSAACPGGLRTGEKVSDVIIGSATSTTSPYARIEVAQGPKANEYIAPVVPGQGYHDFRHVTIEVYGLRAAVLLAVGHMRRVYDWQPKTTASVKAMIIPNADLKHVMPLPGSGRMEEQKERVGSNPVWKGTLEYQVWTVRTIPG